MELDTYDALLAEGAASEVTQGRALEAIRRKIAARVALVSPFQGFAFTAW